MNGEIILDCKNCKHGYICCKGFNVLLQGDEIKKYPHKKLLQRKNIYVLQKDNSGECIFFDELTNQCRIWNERPKACREYDCRCDERAIKLQT